ncbi:hypothetical protein MRX96_041747 [Rhipicephalus microplus]
MMEVPHTGTHTSPGSQHPPPAPAFKEPWQLTGMPPVGRGAKPLKLEHELASEKFIVRPKMMEVPPTGTHTLPGGHHMPQAPASKEPQQLGRNAAGWAQRTAC